jgi:hypothetical protein
MTAPSAFLSPRGLRPESVGEAVGRLSSIRRTPGQSSWCLLVRLRGGRLGAAVTPAAEPVAWVCVRLGGQFELECCAQSQLVRSVLEHCEESTGIVRADRQVDPVAVDCKTDAFGQAGRSVNPKRDVGSNVVSDVDAENQHWPYECPFSVLANAQERLVRAVEVPRADHSSAGSTTSVQIERGIAVDELSCLSKPINSPAASECVSGEP